MIEKDQSGSGTLDDEDPGRTRVLGVDGDPEMRNLLRMAFESLGFSITCAAEGPEGTRLALNGSFQVVVSDLRLPGFSGAELCRRVAVGPDSPRVILIGWYTDARDRMEAHNSGATCFIPMPFCMRELAQVVRLVAMEKESQKGMLPNPRGRSREGVA